MLSLLTISLRWNCLMMTVFSLSLTSKCGSPRMAGSNGNFSQKRQREALCYISSPTILGQLKQQSPTTKCNGLFYHQLPNTETKAIRKITEKLPNNGYPDGWLRGLNMHPRMQKHRNHTKQFRFCLNIQFITDNFSYSICRILNRHKIAARLVNYRSQTIRELTQSKPKSPKKYHSKTCPAPGICQRTSVVYLATCLLCKQEYVGMTIRHLYDRAREHVTSAKQRSASSAFGEHHLVEHHNESPKIGFRIKLIDHGCDESISQKSHYQSTFFGFLFIDFHT